VLTDLVLGRRRGGEFSANAGLYVYKHAFIGAYEVYRERQRKRESGGCIERERCTVAECSRIRAGTHRCTHTHTKTTIISQTHTNTWERRDEVSIVSAEGEVCIAYTSVLVNL